MNLKDSFRIIKLYYLVNKYTAPGEPILKKIIETIEEPKNTTSEDSGWRNLDDFLETK